MTAVASVLGTAQVALAALVEMYCCRVVPVSTLPPLLGVLVALVGGDAYEGTLEGILTRLREAIQGYNKSSEGDAEEVERIFVDRLAGISCLDALYDYLTGLSRLVKDSLESSQERERSEGTDSLRGSSGGAVSAASAPRTVRASSFLGVFLSKITLAVRAMGFEDMIVVWDAFCAYRGLVCPTKDLAAPCWAANLSRQTAAPELISHEDIRHLLAFQAARLQSNGGPVPLDVTRVLDALAATPTGVSESHYVAYLRHWRAGDYDAALSALHRYFDYMMSSRHRYYYHYALLALATLHASFSCEDEALRAINEAIMVAREARDSVCLNYLLAWLFDFLNERPHLENSGDMSRDQILAFLLHKSRDRGSTLQCIALMNRAQLGMFRGENMAGIHADLVSAAHLALAPPLTPPQKTNLIHVWRLLAQMWALVDKHDSLFDVYIDIGRGFCEKWGDWVETVELVLLKARRLVEHGDYDDAHTLMDSFEEKVKLDVNVYKRWRVRRELMRVEEVMQRSEGAEGISRCETLLSGATSLAHTLNHADVNAELELVRAKHALWRHDSSHACAILAAAMDKPAANYWRLKYQVLYGETLGRRGVSIVTNARELAAQAGLGMLATEAQHVLGRIIS